MAQIIGLGELQKALRRVDESMRGEHMAATIKAAADDIAIPDIKDRVPVLSGELRDSLAVRVVDKSESNAVVAIESDLFYARFIEHGTRHRQARPFMRPAIDARRDDIVRRARDLLADRLKEALG